MIRVFVLYASWEDGVWLCVTIVIFRNERARVFFIPQIAHAGTLRYAAVVDYSLNAVHLLSNLGVLCACGTRPLRHGGSCILSNDKLVLKIGTCMSTCQYNKVAVAAMLHFGYSPSFLIVVH